MKIAGWICLVIGVLSFFGAALKGNSVFGPLFWIGLGAFLLYRVNNDKQEIENKSIEVEKEETQVNESIIEAVPENSHNDILKFPDMQLESLEDIQTQLTLEQREAAMCLISFFGGYNNNLMDDAPIMLFKQSAIFFGIPDSTTEISWLMSKYPDGDALIDRVLTINHLKAKEFLLLTCYDLIRSSDSSEAYNLLFNIANDMGYDKTKMRNLINRYK